MSGLEVRLDQHAPIPLAVAFDCEPGEVHALVGPSGSGKSTILRCIAGSHRPQRGSVTVDGERWFDTDAHVCLAPHRRAVGMVFQDYALFPHLSALQNLMAAMGHVPASERPARAESLLALVHLQTLADRRPTELSGGEQQRVAVARALARDPRVLLLDEPFSAVDRPTRQRLYREIADLRRTLNMPTVLVTHDLAEAVMLADRMTVLHRGRTLQTGTPEEITTRPGSEEVARLLDVRNVFPGKVIAQTPDGRHTVIESAGKRLLAAPRKDLAIGREVTWLIADGYVVMHRDEASATAEDSNLLNGTLEGVLAIGPTAHVRFRPHEGLGHLEFSIAAHAARREGFAIGDETTVQLLAEGVHLIPR